MNLVVDGKPARTASGPNTEPGGAESLEAAAWDVRDFQGREARVEIVDKRKGGWGHINVDHIVLADDLGNARIAAQPAVKQDLARRLKVDADFLQLPLLRGADGRRSSAKLSIENPEGKLLRYVHVDLASANQRPDSIYSYDLRELRGQEIVLKYRSSEPGVLNELKLSNEEQRPPYAYFGPHRPRFHFSPRLGWMNDINGSYYQDGLYHVFYQANPTTAATSTGFDMHWGHSVSRDLVHWEEWPIAIFPNGAGQCYSGTAVLARNRVPGVSADAKLPIPTLFFAGTSPFAQHLATSEDGGRSWKRFAENPVVKNMGDGDRDPKVVWHEPSQHYVMVLYVGGPDTYRILRSKDLIHWEQTSSLPHWFECPEFFPVKSAKTGEDLWLLYGCYRNSDPAKGEVFQSNSCFQLGRFDGARFTPVSKIKHAHRGPNFYGALIFANAPANRAIMMGWARDTRFPGEPFNQCASLPLELTLRNLGGEDALCYEPARELEALRGEPLLKSATGAEFAAQLAALDKGAPIEVVVRFRPKGIAPIKMQTRSLKFTYEPEQQIVVFGKDRAPLHANGSITARFLIDRGVVESFWNGGEAAYCAASLHTDEGPAFAIEGEADVEELTVYPLKGIWP